MCYSSIAYTESQPKYQSQAANHWWALLHLVSWTKWIRYDPEKAAGWISIKSWFHLRNSSLIQATSFTPTRTVKTDNIRNWSSWGSSFSFACTSSTPTRTHKSPQNYRLFLWVQYPTSHSLCTLPYYMQVHEDSYHLTTSLGSLTRSLNVWLRACTN